jgi:glycosyltransferase involved in cell wall biosynthesis
MSRPGVGHAPGGTAERIRVAFLTPSLSPGGAERQMLILAATLPPARFDVRFILMSERGAWATEADRLGVPVHVLGLTGAAASLRPKGALAAARALRRYLALTRDVDIVDAWLVPAFTFAGFARLFAHVPVLLAGRRSLLGQYAGKPWYRRASARWATGRADSVVVNSMAGYREATEVEHISPERVILIPNAVLPHHVDGLDRDRRRATWGFGQDDVVVGCVANYKPGKGLEMLIEVAARLREAVPGLRYVLVGDGPSRHELEAAVVRAGLDTVVVMAGRADDARDIYPAFDIAVQASVSEGLPNAILEAAAAGRPIVATAVGGTVDIIEAGSSGILVPADDADALADSLSRLATDAELRGRLGAAAYQRSLDFSPDRLAAATGALYERLNRERGRPG